MKQQGWNTQGKIKIEPPKNCSRTDEFKHAESSTQSHFDSRRFWMSRAAFDLRRTTRGFILILQATLTFGLLWYLIASDQVWLHLLITRCTFCTLQNRIMLKYTPRRFTLGFHLPEVHPRSLRELQIFALVDHGFIVVVPFKSLDEPVPGLGELFVLCRSPCEPLDLTQWPPVMYPLRMRTQRRQRDT